MVDHTAVQQAEEVLDALMQERAALPDRISDARITAIKSGKPTDFRKAEDLENRYARMDFLISNARLTLAQHTIDYQAARIAELSEPRRAARAELATIDEEIRALNERRKKAAGALVAIDSKISSAAHQKKEAENQLAATAKAHRQVFSYRVAVPAGE